ncbi:hypothetical protein ABEB36_007957 [Hypothenemus hampei]|uniref:Uncharacterized protein n=1 Tax=Hypothenemus hampei TaxID=57062 RepID=A0ABD1EVP4_HYPHA
MNLSLIATMQFLRNEDPRKRKHGKNKFHLIVQKMLRTLLERKTCGKKLHHAKHKKE